MRKDDEGRLFATRFEENYRWMDRRGGARRQRVEMDPEQRGAGYSYLVVRERTRNRAQPANDPNRDVLSGGG